MQAPPVKETRNGEAMNDFSQSLANEPSFVEGSGHPGNEGVTRDERLLTESVLHGNLRRFAETALALVQVF